MISARVIADSITPFDARLTTFVLTYPRFIHAEIMTHRCFSRNASSSRAIPVKKMMDSILFEPAGPEFWGSNKPGMQAGEELSDYADDESWRDTGSPNSPLFNVKQAWLDLRDKALSTAAYFESWGLHKQIANRVLEPWMHITVILSGTDWDNFFWLRTDLLAQPEFKVLADRMLVGMNESEPVSIDFGGWHLPFVPNEELATIGLEAAKKASVARCARVSYNNHDGTNPDLVKDAELHDRLKTSGHSSPFEHQATPLEGRHGNFYGWQQYRQNIPNENRTIFPGLMLKNYSNPT